MQKALDATIGENSQLLLKKIITQFVLYVTINDVSK